MTRSGSILTATILGATLAAPAFAQTEGSMPGEGAQGGQTADQVRCSEIAMMDTATVPGTLYFIAGYGEGRRASNMPGGDGASTGTDAGTGTTGQGATTEGATEGTGSSAATGTDTATGSDQSGAGSAGATGSAEGETDAAGATGGAQPQVGTITGYFEVPVERVVQVCTDSPDRTVSEVLEEERQNSGSGN